MPLALEEPIVDLLGAGIALVVGTADESLRPEICRGWGPSWDQETGQLSVALPLPAASVSLKNLERAPSVAFTFTRPTDYDAYQLKGSCVLVRELEAVEWRRARTHFDAFLAEASRVGLEPSAYAPWFPAEARLLVATIDAAFCQAPGRRAGLEL